MKSRATTFCKNPSRQQSIRLPTVTTPPKFAAKKMRSNLFDDGDDDSPQNEDPVELEVDNEYRRRSEYNRQREDLKRYEAEVKKGHIVEDDDDDEDEEASEPEEEIGLDDVTVWMESLVKLRERDPQFLATGKTDGVKKKDQKKKEKKKKKMYLKDVQAQQLLEEGPDFVEEDEGGRRSRVQTYDEQQEELRRAVTDAVEAGGNDDDDDDEDLLKVKEDESEEEDDELKEIADEYFGKESELDEGDKFLRDYLLKQLWKAKDGKEKMEMIDEAEIQHIEKDEDLVAKQEEYETQYRHEENAGEEVMGQSRVVEGSVRKKDNARKTQRKNKEDRMKIAEIERQEELKRLKNVKKKEMKEKMKKVLSIAGFKDGEECPLDAKDLDDEFDPEEYDKMMKAAFDDNYYGAEDDELRSDEDGDDDEKPDFDKEDELLGLPKNWNVIQGGDGFTATREKVLKHKENGDGDDDDDDDDEEQEEEEEEEQRDGKRKRKRKASLVQRAKEALMDEYYKLDYEDTIGDLKTRFKFAKVQPNSYGLEKEEILFLDDTELNQYVPLKKMAPYMEKDWEVNKYMVKEQKLKFNEMLERIDNPDDKRSKKKSKKKDGEQKRDVEETKPAAPIVDEEGEAETSKLSRKAKRRRRQAEKKLPPNRMVAYGKTN